MNQRKRTGLLYGLVPLLLLSTSCSREGEGSTADALVDAPPPGMIVDSVFPVEEQIRRFQAAVRDTPTVLVGGSATRDDLVHRFVAAARAGNVDSLAALTATTGEFAFLYYPNSRFASPPYQLPPDILWFQIQNTQSRGLTRLLRQLEERTLDVAGYECQEEPVEAGPLRLWEDCVALLPGESSDTVRLRLRLFGTILEHRGAFKFLSLSNEL